MTEMFDVVDENNEVIGKETREKVHKEGLKHRAVHIFVINSKGQLFIQKRTMSKDLYPGAWDSSVGGNVGSGETYDYAAKRELKEELGIEVELELKHKLEASPDTGWEFVNFYICKYDGPINIDPEEIEEAHFFDIQQIREDMESGEKKFTPIFKTLFEWYLQNYFK